MKDGTLAKQIDTARSFQADEPQRVEADTGAMVDMGLNMAARVANPSCRPPQATPPPPLAKAAAVAVYNFA